jgi:hypothetical protein
MNLKKRPARSLSVSLWLGSVLSFIALVWRERYSLRVLPWVQMVAALATLAARLSTLHSLWRIAQIRQQIQPVSAHTTQMQSPLRQQPQQSNSRP